MPADRKYPFDWNLLGDLELGRPNLGKTTRLEIYRLMQFTFRDALERRFGTAAADEVFYDAGYASGLAFYDHLLGSAGTFEEFIQKLQEMLREMSIGILRIEQANLEEGTFTLTLSEDLDCSGLPERETEICVYDEGFIAGLLERHTGKPFHVKEIDCWCSGDRTCRFRAEVKQ